MKREYPDAPIVAVAAVVLDGDRILLVKRAGEPGRGRWSIPGGVVKLGERLREAVVREVEEECGILVEVMDLLDVVETIVRDEEGRVRFHYVIVDFLARPLSGQLRASDDALEAAWVRLDDVPKMDITRTLGRLLEKHGDKLKALAELAG